MTKSIQYNSALTITGTLRGSSRQKIYKKRGLEFFQQRRSYSKFCFFIKVIKIRSPKYLFDLTTTARQAYMRRHNNNILHLSVKLKFKKKNLREFGAFQETYIGFH